MLCKAIKGNVNVNGDRRQEALTLAGDCPRVLSVLSCPVPSSPEIQAKIRGLELGGLQYAQCQFEWEMTVHRIAE